MMHTHRRERERKECKLRQWGEEKEGSNGTRCKKTRTIEHTVRETEKRQDRLFDDVENCCMMLHHIVVVVCCLHFR